MRVTVSLLIDAPLERVWEDLADLRSHGDWMQDAEDVQIVSTQQSRVGTVMRVPTRIGPLSTEDWIIVTEWVEYERIGVVHVGLVTGAGVISVASEGHQTRVQWDEELELPMTLGGPIGEVFARPILGAVWTANLRRLAQRFG